MSVLRRIGINIMAAIPAFIIFGGLYTNNTYNRPVVINEQADQWRIEKHTVFRTYKTRREVFTREVTEYDISARIRGNKVRSCDPLRFVSYVDVVGFFEEKSGFEFIEDDTPASSRAQGFQGFGRWLWVSDIGLPKRVKLVVFHRCTNILPFLPDVVVETELEFELEK